MYNLLTGAPQSPSLFALDTSASVLVHGVKTSWELFDLVKDPAELRNVYHEKDYRAERCKLTRLLLRAKQHARDYDALHCPQMLEPRKHKWTQGLVTLGELCLDEE